MRICKTPNCNTETGIRSDSGKFRIFCYPCMILYNRYRIRRPDRTKLYNKQKGKCAICNDKFISEEDNNTVVDHCHTTGKIRGLLCRHCNSGLAFLKEKKKNFKNAIKYLKL